MPFLDVIDEIAAWESRFPVESWTIRGLHVWPLIRVRLGYRLVAIGQDRPKRARKAPRPLRLLRERMRGLRDGPRRLELPPSDVLFFSYPTNRLQIGDAWIDRFFDPIADVLEVNGQKMSKSRGTFVMARTYLDHLDPEYLRYYFAAKLGSGIDDIDLNFEDFVQRVNADLVGKVVNIASRCAGFINKQFADLLAATLPEPALYEEFRSASNTIAQAYENREFSRAMREIMALADRANQYIDERKPWVLAKEDGKEEDIQAICTMGLNLFRCLALYLQPVLPRLAERAAEFLAVEPFKWNDLESPLLNSKITKFKPLMTRIEPDKVNAMIDASKEDQENDSS